MAGAWLVAGIALGAQVLAAWLSPAPDHFADLHVYWGAVRELLTGRGLYSFSAANGDPFTYPPFAALLLVPVAWLGEGAAQAVWTALEVVAVLALARLAVRASVRPSLGPRGLWLPAVVTVLAVSAPVASSIHFGQVSLFVTVAAAATLVGGRSGVWAGLAAAVKLTPMVLLPPIAGRRRRDGLVTAGVFVAAGATAWVVFPHDSVQYWWHELPHGRYGHEALVGNQSLAGLLARHPLPVPATAATLVSVSAMVAILAVGTWCTVRLARCGAALAAFVVASCTGLLLSPVSWTHHQTPVILGALCVCLSTTRGTTVLRGLVVVVMCVNLSALPLPVLGSALDESRLLLIAYLALLGQYDPMETLALRPGETAMVPWGNCATDRATLSSWVS